ncbi:MAG: TetR/AcrR family transcriptional regulator [Pseudomonadota bacterium]
MTRTSRSEEIVECALALLREHGDHGLTMRQVAKRCGMTLSNVQYYFGNRNDLLTAMADRYFGRCLEDIRQLPPLPPDAAESGGLRNMLEGFLAHGLEVSEMCRVFREYWAIATREDAVADYLVRYYRELATILSEKLQPLAASPEALARAVAVIIPYVEGYSITAPAHPIGFKPTCDLFADIVARALREAGID